MSLNINLVCQTCNKEFPVNLSTYKSLGFSNMPKHCPECNDRRQGRPAEAVTKERKCLVEFPAVAIHMPQEIKKLFTRFQADKKDKPALRAIIKGELGQGVSWNGRLDVYCLTDNLPEVGRVRIMEVIHEEGQKRTEVHGEPMGPKEEVTVEYPNTYRYAVIEPVEEGTEPDAALVWCRVDFKTTLKGLGRQYNAQLSTKNALWAKEFDSKCRSGRYGSEMALAVVDDNNPVYGKVTGDIQKYIRWTFSSPKGKADYTEDIV